jgi:hypothetical protein
MRVFTGFTLGRGNFGREGSKKMVTAEWLEPPTFEVKS